jgi:hypothetical protein
MQSIVSAGKSAWSSFKLSHHFSNDHDTNDTKYSSGFVAVSELQLPPRKLPNLT